MAVAARALWEGFDAAHGGMYEAGVPGAPPGVGKGAQLGNETVSRSCSIALLHGPFTLLPYSTLCLHRP
jgi:hypothetical protein